MMTDSIPLIAPTISLFLGLFFFLYAARYFIFVGLTLSSGARRVNANRNGNGNGKGNGNGNGSSYRHGFLSRFAPNGGNHNGDGNHNGNDNHNGNGASYPFVSIHLPFYNEKNVALRILNACVSLSYQNYEIIVIDDSNDGTFEAISKWAEYPQPINIKIIHRVDRSGFKGGALNVALDHTDPRAEYVAIFDADFIPPPDIINQFLGYFTSNINNHNGSGNSNGNHNGNGINNGFRTFFLSRFNQNGNHNSKGNGNHNGDGGRSEPEALIRAVEEYYRQREIAVVQGYQWHKLNESENWITRGVRAEYSGSYMVERSCQEILGAMKMISGSVYMIKADVLKQYRWSTSLTEDWELTLRLYQAGYKVLYTPLIAVPAEIPSTISRLIKQRMRWAEGHTYNAKQYFWKILRSRKLSLMEKLEFLYFAPYYLQSLIFIVGTTFWLISESLHSYLPMWTASFGWALVLSNLISLPLMNLSGLFLESSAEKDWRGILSCVVLSYIMAPYMAYAALRGLLERREGTWIRTYKTGLITEKIIPLRIRRIGRWFRRVGRKKPAGKKARKERKLKFPGLSLALLLITSSMTLGISALSASVPMARAETILADNKWYLYNTGALDMNETSGTSGSYPMPDDVTTSWYSEWSYDTAQDVGGTWVLTLIVAAAGENLKGLIATATIYSSSDRVGTSNQQLATQTWTIPSTFPSTVTVNLVVTGGTTNTYGYIRLAIAVPSVTGKQVVTINTGGSGDSSLVSPTTLVPENGLLLLLVAPIIPISFARAKNKKEK